MAMQNDRAAIQVAALDLQKVNDAFRRVSQQITLLEGRSGTVGVRDSMTITSDKQTLIDFDSSTAGKGSIVAFGTENATLALAKGSRKEDNGEWVATDTTSTIFALDRAGNGTLYYNSGLTVGQAFNPTAIYVIGSGGSVGAHALTGGSSPHTESGLTPGYVLTATGATTFGWAAAPAGVTDHGALTGLADDDHTQYLNTTRHAAIDAADHGSGASTDGQVLTSDGAGGAAWEDATGSSSPTAGTYLLTANTTPVGNVGTGNDDLITYSLPAGTLAADGDSIRCIFSGTFAANTNAKTGTIYFGASNSLVISNSSSGVLHWLAEMVVTRLSATTQRIHIRGNSNGAAVYNQYLDGAETLANAITIKVVGTGTSNDDIVQKFLTVEYLPLGGGPIPQQVDIQTFTLTAQSPWTKPTSFTPQKVWVRMWGAGGGGGGGGTAADGTKRYGGAGGGGGACNDRWFKASELGTTETLVVGVGGTPGAGGTAVATPGTDGGVGSASTFGTTVRMYAGGGGGGRGGGAGGGGIYNGGGGGGTGGLGVTGATSTTNGIGGAPNPFLGTSTANYPASGGAGANSLGSAATSGSYAEWGGGGGGTSNNAANPVSTGGGASAWGGGGGGAGAGINSSNVSSAAGAGGAAGTFPLPVIGGGGAAGTGAGPGTDGADGTINFGGAGGGGGHGSAVGVGGAGGAGGDRGGGGGGGGAGADTAGGDGGAGGTGGRGEIIVITYG